MTSSWAEVTQLATYDGALVAGGWFPDDEDSTNSFFVERWNGARWSPLGGLSSRLGQPDPYWPMSANLERLRRDRLGSVRRREISRSGRGRTESRGWDGAVWHTDEDSLRSEVDDIASYGNRLYAAGPLSVDGTRPAAPLVRREQNRWMCPRRRREPASHGLIRMVRVRRCAS